jgi:hypothetical protein
LFVFSSGYLGVQGIRGGAERTWLRATGRRLADAGREFLIAGVELAPPRPEISGLPPGDIVAQVFDLGLDPRPVRS